MAVFGPPEVHFGEVRLQGDGGFDCAEGVLRRMAGGATMADLQHDITWVTPAGEGLRLG